MTLQAVLDELQAMGSASIKKVLMNHGAKEPFWGVKVGDMKSIVKKVKKTMNCRCNCTTPAFRMRCTSPD